LKLLGKWDIKIEQLMATIFAEEAIPFRQCSEDKKTEKRGSSSPVIHSDILVKPEGYSQ